jgi:F-type H+-transporting ATPase subunit a
MNIFALSFEKIECRMQKINNLCRISLVFLLTVFTILTGSVKAWADADSLRTESSEMQAPPAEAGNASNESSEGGNKKFNAGDMIFGHILDAHDWHLWGEGHSAVAIPLPVIIYSSRGLDVFLSSNFHHSHSTYHGYMLHRKDGEKKYSIVAVNEMEPVDAHAATVNEEVTASLYDLSITKNVMAIIISGFLLVLIMTTVAKSYARREGMAPKGIQSLMEPLIIMIRDDVAKPSIGGKKYEKFMPYLLTVFFFILINNLMGLIPFFPGGANLTGNIAATLALAAITFFIQLLNSNKNFWKHVVAMPGVPKAVLFILTPIELLGVVLRPFVLMVRLFANITAGHIVALAFVSMIFIFKESFGNGGAYGISIFSGIMYVFMGFLELLVAFLQAYVFTLLSAIYFGAAVEEHHHDAEHRDAHVEEAAII